MATKNQKLINDIVRISVLEEELEYYQHELKHILLLFDIRLVNETKIDGTGKQREFMYISSVGLFDKF